MNFKKEDLKDTSYLYHDETLEIKVELLVEDWEEMYAKIEDLLVEKMNLGSEVKNLLKAYSVAEKTKARLKEAECVIKKSWEVCNLSEQYIYDALHRKIDWLEQALIDYEKTKAGAGSAARNLRKDNISPDCNGGSELVKTSENITNEHITKVAGEVDSQVLQTSQKGVKKGDSTLIQEKPATPQACNNEKCDGIITAKEHVGNNMYICPKCDLGNYLPELTDGASTLLDKSDKDVAEGRTQIFNNVDDALDTLDKMQKEDCLDDL